MALKILSIDGGGIRGLIPAMVLAHIENHTKRRIADLFDVIAGTSTGGILACGLVVPDAAGKPRWSAADLVKLYAEQGHEIFPQRRFEAVLDKFREKYPEQPIERVLQRYCGDTRLKGSLTGVFITSYDIERRRPFFFRSAKAKIDGSYDFPLWMVARATSAAPTYFEPFKMPAQPPDNYYALVDGGVFANNPAMCAYVDASVGTAEKSREVMLVSLGTGSLTKPFPYNDVKHWGVMQWARPILDVVFDGVSDTTEYELQQVLEPQRYWRFQVALNIASDRMDDAEPENIAKLQEQAEQLIVTKRSDLDSVCERLIAA